jgi:hypothetical protein
MVLPKPLQKTLPKHILACKSGRSGSRGPHSSQEALTVYHAFRRDLMAQLEGRIELTSALNTKRDVMAASGYPSTTSRGRRLSFTSDRACRLQWGHLINLV